MPEPTTAASLVEQLIASDKVTRTVAEFYEAKLATLSERLEAAERWAKAERAGRKQERARADNAEQERDEWEKRYEELLGKVGGVWPG